MKFRFNYETEFNVWIVQKERLIKLNAKKHNISMDFSEHNTLYAKKDSYVFITHKQGNDLFQLIVNNQTQFDKVPYELKQLTDPARELVGTVFVNDFFNLKQ